MKGKKILEEIERIVKENKMLKADLKAYTRVLSSMGLIKIDKKNINKGVMETIIYECLTSIPNFNISREQRQIINNKIIDSMLAKNLLNWESFYEKM